MPQFDSLAPGVPVADCTACTKRFILATLTTVDGWHYCRQCIHEIHKHRAIQGLADAYSAGLLPEQRGDKRWNWLMWDAKQALREMPQYDREQWIGRDEWMAKRSRDPDSWSFSSVLKEPQTRQE